MGFMLQNCNQLNLDNPCELNSKQYSNFQVLKLATGSDLSNCARVIGNTQSTDLSSKVITTFSFTSALNEISRTYEGTIVGDNITISIPYGIRSSAIPTFAHSGKSIQIGDTILESGITISNFSSNTTLKVTAQDGTTKDYNLTVMPIVLIPDTAQTSCWDQAGALLGSCSGTGHDGAYENIPHTRNFSDPTTKTAYPSDAITYDKLNGLTWKTCAEGFSGVTCTTGGTTQSFAASATLCSNLNSTNSGSGYAGKKNWRVPTIIELANLANFQNVSPTLALDSNSFPGTLAANTFWSSTPNASNTANSWVVNFSSNNISDLAIATLANVRCVAGDLPPSGNFTDNGDSTVTDNNTKLVWAKCSDGLTGTTCTGGGLNSQILSTNLTICNTYTLAGKTWRLPNANELRSLMDYSLTTPTLINSSFPNTNATQYWTSSTNPNTTTTGFLHYFNTGSFAALGKGSPRPFRCVAN